MGSKLSAQTSWKSRLCMTLKVRSFTTYACVARSYFRVDEITSIAAANIAWDLLALMAKNPLVA
jgi:hypothetical protein